MDTVAGKESHSAYHHRAAHREKSNAPGAVSAAITTSGGAGVLERNGNPMRALCGYALAVVSGAVASLCWVSLTAAQVIYVNNNIASPNNSVSALQASSTGALTPISGSPYLTGGGGSSSPNLGAVDILTAAGFLYASNSVTNTIAAFQINPDGTLTTIPGSPFPTLATRPNGIAIDAITGRLFACDYVSNNVAVFDIASNGALTLVLGAPFGVAAGPIDLEIDSANALLFASHDLLGVGVYSIALDGSLTAIGGSPFATGGSGLRGLAINSGATLLYAANGTSNTVSGFTIGGGGTLSAVGSPFATGTGPTGVNVHPTKNVLYVSADSSNDISAYSIAMPGGALTPLAGSPFASGGVGTSGMVVDAAHQFLFAVNGGTNPSPSRDVSVFSIGSAGDLTSVAGSPFSTGVASGRPASIAFSTITRPDCTDAAPGVCIPGRGKTSTDCVAEWFVDTDPTPSVNPRDGLPDVSVGCQSGNPGCDFDALDSQCTFHVRVCINSADPRLAGCTPSDVAKFDLLRPQQGKGDAADAVNVTEFQKAVSGGTCNNDAFRSCLFNADCQFGGTCDGAPVIGVPFVRRHSVLISGATNSTLNVCSNTMDLVVPLRPVASGFKAKSKSIRAKVTTSGGVKDTDLLKLSCFPGP